MNRVYRCYAEKRPGFDVEAQQLYSELKEQLGMEGLTGVRILYRYDVEGLSEEVYRQAEGTVFSEPMVDSFYEEEPPPPWTAPTPSWRWRSCPASSTSGRIPAPSASSFWRGVTGLW